MDKKISIGSWAYTFGPYEEKPVSLPTVVQKLGELGYDGIELNGFKPHAHPDLYPTKEDRDRLVKMINDNGLEMPGYAPEFFPFFPASPDEEIQKEYEKLGSRGAEELGSRGAPEMERKEKWERRL